MGFNKRYVTLETIISIIDNKEDLERYFKNADALFFADTLSMKIYNLVMEKKSYKHLINKIKKNGH